MTELGDTHCRDLVRRSEVIAGPRWYAGDVRDLVYQLIAKLEAWVEPLDYEVMDVCRGMPHLYAHCFPTWMSQELPLSEAFETAYLSNIFDETFVYPGIMEMLSILHGRFALGVVTNKPQAATERLLEAANLRRFFDVVVGGDRCEASKPSPIPLQFAHGVVNDGCNNMVGDSVGDVRCAGPAGALSVCVIGGTARSNDAHFSLESPSA